jgi:hypothetical protein
VRALGALERSATGALGGRAVAAPSWPLPPRRGSGDPDAPFLVSYGGTCCVGVNVDTGAVPDTDVLMDCLQHGFDEVLAVGG